MDSDEYSRATEAVNEADDKLVAAGKREAIVDDPAED